MNDIKLCLSLGPVKELPVEEQIKLYKSAGFDAFFPCYESDEQIELLDGLAKKHGMEIQSIHAPFVGVDALWREGEKGDAFLNTLIACVKCAGKFGIPIVVCHAYIGFYTGEKPTQLGIERVRALAEGAKSVGVKVAFENTEGDEFLSAIMDAFKADESVGFCWDSGHEQCYNYSKDLLALYGDKLIATHLNDNLGITDFNGVITWTDDLHLLPFDGMIDWLDAGERLARTGFNGTLTFELNRSSKPNRHDNDKYKNMTSSEYVFEAYARAVRFANIFKRKVNLK